MPSRVCICGAFEEIEVKQMTRQEQQIKQLPSTANLSTPIGLGSFISSGRMAVVALAALFAVGCMAEQAEEPPQAATLAIAQAALTADQCDWYATLDDDGKIIILAKLGAGEFFGEQALMPDSKGKRNAFVRANIKTRVIKIPKEYFRLILSRDDKIAAELSEIQKKR